MHRSSFAARSCPVTRKHAGLMAFWVFVVGVGCAAIPAFEPEEDGEGAEGASVAVTGGSILFVGNSFTHGNEEPAYSYNKAAVTDTNGTGMGGIPGIFKKLTVQAGLSFDVSVEAASGQSLAWHAANRAAIIGQAKWNTVVFQEQSLMPLPVARGGSPTGFMDAARSLRALVLAKNPAANLFLYETWASPASVGTQGYPSGVAGLQAMQVDLRDAYFKASRELGFAGVARVGEGFLRAVDQGLADPNPADGITPGMFDLWSAQDSRHSSRYGSYLSATVLFARLTQVDPRTLATGAGSAAAELGISATDAVNLHRIAFEVTALAEPPAAVPTRQPVTGATFTGAVTAGTPVRLTGLASLASLTTAEGTFTQLVGATASGITGTNLPSSVGTVPAHANGAATGLGAHDGANNMGTGTFQFGTSFSAKTRFFIVDSTTTATTTGDDVTVTLVDAANQPVGTYSLSLLASDFTPSAAGSASTALATLSYTSGVASLTGNPPGTVPSKLAAVSFSLADLGVSDAASVSGARGLRLSSATLDPNVVGLYVVP
ncbi:cell division protein FtsK [Myxococcus sp. K15C18031901]|uniref:cell division protein FtsK n=1 Tax=Myxococcus dinghuensis TaxID=2906761 RepID=UPI0020A817DD|nr:cell division protein FtsK [Myxococcus dinghuensis]MCP3097930.1 cell division protein FtsK [Myxococcus dinghuensis]